MVTTLKSLILAIALIESGNDPTKIGKNGERTEFQITRTVWKEHSVRPFGEAKEAPLVVERRLKYLSNTFYRSTKRRPTNAELYIMWNKGYGYYKKHKFNIKIVPLKYRDRAERFANVVIDLEYNLTTKK